MSHAKPTGRNAGSQVGSSPRSDPCLHDFGARRHLPNPRSREVAGARPRRRRALRRRQEVVERDVQERPACLGEDLVAVTELGIDVDPPPAAVRHPGGERELVVDEDRPPVAHEDPRRHGREAVPRGQEPAGLVEGRGDQAAVDDAGPGLVVVAEGDGRLVAVDALVRSAAEDGGPWGCRRTPSTPGRGAAGSPPPLPEAAALEMRAVEVLRARRRHRRRGGDLEGEGRGGHDLREAVDLAGAVALHEP